MLLEHRREVRDTNERKDIKEGIAFMFKNKTFDENTKINYSKIAREHGCDWRTVKKYYLSRGSPPTKRNIENIPSKLDPYKQIILDKYDNNVPATGIYMFLKKRKGYTGSYSLITKFLREENRKRTHQAIIRFETEPGKQAQVDWKESLIFKTKSGKSIKFNIFLITLGFSRMRFIKVTETRDQQTVFNCLFLAFYFFNGIPKEILFDNMRSITDKSRTTYDNVVYNDTFLAFAKEAGFIPKNCVAYRPCTKGKVESVARLMNRLKAFNSEIESFEDIEKETNEFNIDINNEIHKGTGKKPIELFEKEKEHLLPLGEYYRDRMMDFIDPDPRRKVSKESLFSYKGHKYSVPPKYIGKYVYIVNDNNVEFDITDEKGHWIKHQEYGNKATNYSLGDYLEISKNSSIKMWKDEDLEKHAEEVLGIYDKL